MLGVLDTLKANYSFLTGQEKSQAQEAVRKGIDVILKTQIRVNGKPTVWCAQHDEVTLAPAKARAFELASYSGSESVGLVRFLMSVDDPGLEIIEAVEGAVEWFRAHAITGIREVKQAAPGTPKGYDKVVVKDPAAPPLWARFYDLEHAEPLFCGRDSKPKRSLAEIEYERRNGYAWYTDRPAKLLDVDYPKWKARMRGAR
jgi:PelA/Pel-15E family pectate lyase